MITVTVVLRGGTELVVHMSEEQALHLVEKWSDIVTVGRLYSVVAFAYDSEGEEGTHMSYVDGSQIAAISYQLPSK